MSTPLSIALIEDHETLRVMTAEYLRMQGHFVFEMESAEDMEEVVGGETIHLFILDLNLPGEDGLAFAGRLRETQPDVGIIMLTARGSAEHIADGYRGGADVYLVKPVNPNMLLASIESVTRRLPIQQRSLTAFRLDVVSLCLEGPKGKVNLNQAEAAVLVGLVRSPHRRLDHFKISELMGQTEGNFRQQSIEVRITRLRKKIFSVGGNMGCIKNQRLVGYQLCIALEVA